MKKIIISISLFVLVISLILYVIFNRHAYSFSGYAIGTTYKVVVYDRYISPEKLYFMKMAVEDEIARMNMIFSTFEPDSEVSKLNSASPNVEYYVADEFFRVLVLAGEVYRNTNGHYDPTVDPLVRLWGFGRDDRYNYPSKFEVDSLIKYVGYDKLIITNNIVVKKKDVTIDLASVAKGYVVDKVVEVIKRLDKKDFMVEIGGELYVHGDEFYREGWDVVVAYPEIEKEGIMTLRLNNKGVATSGSYRNFRFAEDGKKYHHIIDAKTGYPVISDLVSVTVVAENVARADALATGLFVMGADEGLKIVNALDDVEAVFIEKTEEGLNIKKSNGI